MSKRKETEKFILSFIAEVVNDSNNINIKLYKDLFKSMSDKEFHAFMEYHKDNILNIIVDEDISKNKISVSNNLKIAKKYGYPLFQYTYTAGIDDIPPVRSLHKSYMLLLPVRRTKHTVTKGVSVSEDSKHFDTITGQPTGISRSSKKSNPEAQLLLSMGLNESVKEFMIDRSDRERSNIMISSLKKYGTISSGVVNHYGDVRQTTKTLSAYLNGMHLKLSL